MQRLDSAVKLTDEMLGRVKSLESACRSFDKTSSSISLAQELNFHKDMKSFFLASDGEKLAGIVSVFAPVKGQAELSALVLPEKGSRAYSQRCSGQPWKSSKGSM